MAKNSIDNMTGHDNRKMNNDAGYDVVALGELLIDFTDSGVSEQGNPVMEANPGGAPCNVLAMLRRCGRKVGFIGKVGNDIFGRQLERALTEVGISTEGLVVADDVRTTLAFVRNDERGEREFSFYRNPGADMMLTADEVRDRKAMISGAEVFHFGSLSMTDEPVASATSCAIEIARDAGALITYDPNLREPLWDSLERAREMIAWGLLQCDVVKISDNEVLWFTGLEGAGDECGSCDDCGADGVDPDVYDIAVERLVRDYPGIKLVMLTLGENGSRAYVPREFYCSDDKFSVNGYRVRMDSVRAEAFLQPDTVDTTGAGDTFCGVAIHHILEHGIDELCDNKGLLEQMLREANLAAGIITTRKGALRVMPEWTVE